ncbi:MAG: ATP--guanido phosphotransferase [Elusimicrobiota bacterium]
MQLKGMLRHKMGWAEPKGAHHGVVLASRVRLARNLSSEHFPAHASPSALKRVLDAAFLAAQYGPLAQAAFLKVGDFAAVDRRLLVERHLISPLLEAHPAQRGVIIAADECLSLMINEEDHLRLAALQPGLSLRQAYRHAEALDESLETGLRYGFRSDWGYLTACPSNLGTGLRASCLVHLPGLGLTGLMDQVLENLKRAGLIARGLYGEGTKVMGDFFQISNATGLGRTEAEILGAIEKAVGQLAERELECRERLASGPNRARLEDTVYRAVGLLSSARLLSFEEACHHLSALRVGLTLGWDVPGDIGLVNELLLLVQPAHLTLLAEKDLPAAEAASLRAALVRRRLGKD